VPKRGRRNEPALLVHTAERLAQERGIEPEEVARTTNENVARLFRLGN
jgi:TatD DNase family protein